MNIYYNHTRKAPPETPEECLREDRISTELWSLANIIEVWGKIVFIVLIVAGIISTIAITVAIADIFDEALAFPAFLISTVIWGFSAFLEYCIYHILALYTGAHASIVQNTKTSTNIALFQLTKGNAFANTTNLNTTHDNSSSVTQPHSFTDVWSCLHCGTQNKNEYGQCKKCGKFRSR